MLLASTQTEKLMAEFCITLIFTLNKANSAKMVERFSSAMKEKSLEKMESSTWLVLRMKQGTLWYSLKEWITLPGSSG